MHLVYFKGDFLHISEGTRTTDFYNPVYIVYLGHGCPYVVCSPRDALHFVAMCIKRLCTRPSQINFTLQGYRYDRVHTPPPGWKNVYVIPNYAWVKNKPYFLV